MSGDEPSPLVKGGNDRLSHGGDGSTASGETVRKQQQQRTDPHPALGHDLVDLQFATTSQAPDSAAITKKAPSLLSRSKVLKPSTNDEDQQLGQIDQEHTGKVKERENDDLHRLRRQQQQQSLHDSAAHPRDKHQTYVMKRRWGELDQSLYVPEEYLAYLEDVDDVELRILYRDTVVHLLEEKAKRKAEKGAVPEYPFNISPSSLLQYVLAFSKSLFTSQ